MSDQAGFVQGVDFICIPTQDWEQAKAFYEDVLGLEHTIRWGSMPAGEFETGNLTIAVMQSDAFGMPFAPHGAPVAFKVDDVVERRAELEAKGIEFMGETIDSGVCHQALFKDPDGNVLNLHHRYAPR